MTFTQPPARGNILFMLLVAIVLIAGLTYAITRSDGGVTNLSREKTSIAADEVASFAVDIRRGIETMTRTGRSESTISFAHASLNGYGTPETAPDAEIFNIAGGGVAFVDVPSGINDGSQWEFYSYTAAPGVGDDATPDLVLVLPNVTETFCRAYNTKAGYDQAAAIPTDTGVCINDTSKRFDGTFASGGAINTMTTATFRSPAGFACVACDSGAYHAYYTLIER